MNHKLVVPSRTRTVPRRRPHASSVQARKGNRRTQEILYSMSNKDKKAMDQILDPLVEGGQVQNVLSRDKSLQRSHRLSSYGKKKKRKTEGSSGFILVDTQFLVDFGNAYCCFVPLFQEWFHFARPCEFVDCLVQSPKDALVLADCFL